jgi:Tripartite tricarboxylate transporter TctB family
VIGSRQGVVLTAGLTVLVASVLVSASSLGPAARRMPLVVAVPVLALLVFELTRQVRSARHETEDRQSRRVEAVTFVWLGGLVGGVWLLGMLVALPLFLATHLRLRSRESWAVALWMALGVWAVLFGVLDHTLGIQMHDGVLGALIGGWRR